MESMRRESNEETVRRMEKHRKSKEQGQNLFKHVKYRTFCNNVKVFIATFDQLIHPY